jgi:hypothetical protein
MNEAFTEQIQSMTGASAIEKREDIQSLWSGYGEISRYRLKDSQHKQVIVKHVKLPEHSQHPRGWNTLRSHQRKIRSYQVECTWYQNFSSLCDRSCRVPQCYGTSRSDSEFLMVMEDLSDSGFTILKEEASLADMSLCLAWLANFHATFMGQAPHSLWPIGTYWHLETRPDELDSLKDHALKAAAPEIDQRLSDSPFQTLVHGDAKLANFCFHNKGNEVAAVDFQYVGGGCGMKDVAYFIGSCLNEDECEDYETQLLDIYFEQLKQALNTKQPHINPKAVEANWRALFPFAWADFHRFLKGWSPNHWKIHRYSERISHSVIEELKQGI